MAGILVKSAAALLTLASLLQEPVKAVILFHGLCVRMGIATGKVETTQVGSILVDLTCVCDASSWCCLVVWRALLIMYCLTASTSISLSGRLVAITAALDQSSHSPLHR